jgi:hypothetical protein
MWHIYVVDSETQHWRDLSEGPWDTAEQALAFAHAEVGVPWVVADEGMIPFAFGDALGHKTS